MRAFVVTGPGEASVQDVAVPSILPGQVLVEVERVGLCGTDMELFSGEMAYFASGETSYPLRIGHEWCGTVIALGTGVDSGWSGRRVTGDTMIGCGTCERCRRGRHHVCADRAELGVRDGMPGALAEYVAVPETALHALPDAIDVTAGALVEPGGNALRAVQSAGVDAGERLLILGTGTIALLAAQFARARGLEVMLTARSVPDGGFARSSGFEVSTLESVRESSWDAVIDATNAAEAPNWAADLVEPGRRMVLIGLSGAPSDVDTRRLVLKDVCAVGILGASPALAETIEVYASGAVNPGIVVRATVGMDQVADVLRGASPPGIGDGPKTHVDPRR